jgi:hypothetical protein
MVSEKIDARILLSEMFETARRFDFIPTNVIVPPCLFFQIQVASRPLKSGYRPPNGKRARRRLWGKLRRETYLRVMPKQMRRGPPVNTARIICARRIPLN